MKRIKKNLLLLILTNLLIISCSSRKTPEPEQTVLARIGDKEIMVDEFIHRAEYTIRPPYCKGNYMVDKKIILNSLIAEKLLALEAGTNNPLLQNSEFQSYITGRREQAMRQWQFHAEVYTKAEPDTGEIKTLFKYAGRTYKIAYFSVGDKQRADYIAGELTCKDFNRVFHDLGGLQELPQREVAWKDEANDAIHQALFSDSLQAGQVVGPIAAEEDLYLFIQVLDWTNSMVIGEQQIQTRWNEVREKLKNRYALKLYQEYVANTMKGKTAEFYGDALFKLAELMQPFYLKTDKDKKNEFKKRFWDKDDTDPLAAQDDYLQEMEKLLDLPIVKIDGQDWDVKKLLNEIDKHPLVFRKRNMSSAEFPEQFKLALVDLIRDRYLTEKAYSSGYDKVNIVEHNAMMWQDYMVSVYQRRAWLTSQGITQNFESNYYPIIQEHLNEYVNDLQKKYSGQIEINTQMFNEIKLTRIDMFAMQKYNPFPVMVPSFPLLTTDTALDYGKKMK